MRADTFIVRPIPASRLTARASLGPAQVGQRYCTEDRCVVVADVDAQKAALQDLEKRGLITLQAFPDARRVFLPGAVWDGETGSFDASPPGITELPSNSPESLFAVIFKSFPEATWLMALENAGFVVTEPLPTMAYLVYGDRDALARFAAKTPYIYRVIEVPSGLRRSNIDTYLPTDKGNEPASTLVAIVNVSSSEVKKMLVQARGGEPPVEYRMNHIVAHSAILARADALYLSRFPEVVQITRQTFRGGPSDERSNRIVAGTWQSPGTSWPTTLGANTYNGLYYWDDYLSRLPVAFPGFNLSNQTIGFLDTGVDAGLQENYSGTCPAHLYDPSSGSCRLAFTTDVTTDFTNPNLRADDRAGHGSMTSAVAAGYVNAQSPGRDGDNYSFTQGVAQGATLAMTKFFGFGSTYCDAGYRQVVPGGAELTFDGSAFLPRVRYATVVTNGRNPLPSVDFAGSPPGPGASIFNHSWNIFSGFTNRYEDVSLLLDQTTRNPVFASFDFGYNSAHNVFVATGNPALHVVAAGNFVTGNTDNFVLPPGIAKNILTVGATETYNQQFYGSGVQGDCPTTNDAAHAVNTSLVPAFSRISPDPGPINFRYKPELVAPGTRLYGRRSSRYTPDAYLTCFLCNADLTFSQQYAWDRGTSFATPAVAGAAALVREWLSRLNVSTPFVSPSPALVKATLIGSARLLQGTGAPDRSQGYGGLSLDVLFRPVGNYFFLDQTFSLPNQGNYVWEKTLTVSAGQDVAIALAWTDRASAVGDGPLVNNLDLRVQAGAYFWYGNNFSGGYSTRNPSPPVYDSVNASEKVLIRSSDLGGATQVTVRVSAFSITGDGLYPGAGLYPRQDFALAVINAHE